MDAHPDRKKDAEKREPRGADFPGLNPELAAADGDRESGRKAEKNSRSDAEMAGELAVPDAKARGRRRADGPGIGQRDARRSAATDAGRATGLFALAIAVASLFVWSLPLGLTAAILGWYSFREGARGLGVWAMVIGLMAALSQLVLIPIQAAWM